MKKKKRRRRRRRSRSEMSYDGRCHSSPVARGPLGMFTDRNHLQYMYITSAFILNL